MKPADPVPKTAVCITPREAAEYLNVGVDIIYDGCAAGGLKHAARASHVPSAPRVVRRLGRSTYARLEVRRGHAEAQS